MTNFPKNNPSLPDHINNAHESPLKDFAALIAGAVIMVIISMLLIGWSASWLGPKIPFNWEPSVTFPDAEILSDLDLKKQAYLQDLVEQLSMHTEQAVPVTVHWLPNIELANAFATSGGHIHVTSGLLDAVESENALAMVLAHEYAHIELRHPAILMLQQLGSSALLSLLGISDSASKVITHQSSSLTILSFSRSMEAQADERALELIHSKYGHTSGADGFFVNMLEQRKDNHQNGIAQTWRERLNITSSHPRTDDRLHKIREATLTDATLTPLPSIFYDAKSSK